MNPREILLVAGKELRETLRDRRTLAVMILFPLVVYPLVSLVTAQVLATRVNRAVAQPSRVAVNGSVALAEGVRTRLRAAGQGDVVLAPATATADLSANRVDAIVDVAPGAAAGRPPAVQVLFDETRETSTAARDRVQQVLAGAGGPACAPAYAVTAKGIAPRTRVGGYVLSKILPLVVVVMVMLGAFHPAIDITAGERERSTLETTLSAPIARSSLMAGKVLAVATLASLTGFLNLASMSLTVLEGARLVAGQAGQIAVPWLRAATALAVIPPAAFLFASVMVAIGALARSFKEAQTLLTPVYFLCMAPSLTAAIGDFPLKGGALFVPGVGVTLLARDLITGQATAAGVLLVLGSTVAYGAAALTLAARLYDSERLLGADDAGLSLGAWLRHLARGWSTTEARAPDAPTAGHAIALYAVACVMLFFVFVPLQAWRLGAGLVISEWGGLFGLTALYARGVGRPLRAVLHFKLPPPAALAGAVLIGLSAWLVVGLLADWIAPAPREVTEHLRHAIAPPEGRSLLLTLALMALSPAICEEALFRGPILRGLATRFSAAGAAILTGLLFGLFHGDIWRLLPTGVLGVILSGLALATDSIIPSMVAHFVNNASLVILARTHADEPEGLPLRLRLALLAAGTIVFLAGVALVARSRQRRGAQ
jgi:sodium transport system permease protein